MVVLRFNIKVNEFKQLFVAILQTVPFLDVFLIAMARRMTLILMRTSNADCRPEAQELIFLYIWLLFLFTLGVTKIVIVARIRATVL